LKVLLVEDDEVVRAVLAEVLDDAGYEVLETGDPHQALRLSDAAAPPDMLVTDIDLSSELNGFDLASRARLRWPKVLVVLISGLPADHTGQSLTPGDRYIQKPFTGDHLIGQIKQMAIGP